MEEITKIKRKTILACFSLQPNQLCTTVTNYLLLLLIGKWAHRVALNYSSPNLRSQDQDFHRVIIVMKVILMHPLIQEVQKMAQTVKHHAKNNLLRNSKENKRLKCAKVGS